ncbi:hypothetical protein [Paenibacillus montanisoli]|uniref:Uracil-DNA glycosylase-like domain-containing protein n=1 Tax=Paenibacillus montanisoli TaxID=2081970 RepID=A0A328TVI5_9BACL|nr:hypothetical protein [Paenibacillus montanisoli]RAP74360.1 hypothetical protein DL346_19955 [Paenibacillus montanisoli]
MNRKEAILELAQVYSNYAIYPKKRFIDNTALRVFQRTHSENHYAHEIEFLLQNQKDESDRLGADLPWWGKKYFTLDKGTRVFIISQDSLSEDAGSIAFYMNLMNESVMDTNSYNNYIHNNRLERFASWGMAKNYLIECGIDLDFAFVTDARKVYPRDTMKFKQFISEQKRKTLRDDSYVYGFQKDLLNLNVKESKELLVSEINFCKPDLIITLGEVGFHYLHREIPLTPVLKQSNTTVPILAEDVIVKRDFIAAPFPGKKNETFIPPYTTNSINTIRRNLRCIN